jgi:UDP-glucuronate decarboxylase
LAQKVIAMTSSKSQIVNCPLPGDDPRQRQPDVTLARAKLDWAPAVQLDAGLQRTIEYFSSLLSGALRQ